LNYVLQNGLFCDVKFIVGTEREEIFSHSFMLKIRSAIFEKLVTRISSSSLNNAYQEIVIENIKPIAFHKFLKVRYPC